MDATKLQFGGPDGTLVLRGKVDALRQIKAQVADRVKSAKLMMPQVPVLGFTEDGALALLREVAKPQFDMLAVAIDNGGLVSAREMRRRLGVMELTGKQTGISKAVKRLVERGTLGSNASNPLRTIYDGGGPADAFRIRDELVPVFRRALERYRAPKKLRIKSTTG